MSLKAGAWGWTAMYRGWTVSCRPDTSEGQSVLLLWAELCWAKLPRRNWSSDLRVCLCIREHEWLFPCYCCSLSRQVNKLERTCYCMVWFSSGNNPTQAPCDNGCVPLPSSGKTSREETGKRLVLLVSIIWLLLKTFSRSSNQTSVHRFSPSMSWVQVLHRNKAEEA